MPSKVLDIIRNVLRGVWRPLYPLDSRRRWWHYLEYWSHRVQDIAAALCVVLFPFGIGFLVFDRYAINPTGTVAFAAILAILWLCFVALSYSRGRAMVARDTTSRDAPNDGIQ